MSETRDLDWTSQSNDLRKIFEKALESLIAFYNHLISDLQHANTDMHAKIVLLEQSQRQETETGGDAPDRMTKLRELVDYFHSVTGAVPPEGTSWPDGSYAFDAAADYVQAIIDGRFDDLPWGVADAHEAQS